MHLIIAIALKKLNNICELTVTRQSLTILTEGEIQSCVSVLQLWPCACHCVIDFQCDLFDCDERKKGEWVCSINLTEAICCSMRNNYSVHAYSHAVEMCTDVYAFILISLTPVQSHIIVTAFIRNIVSPCRCSQLDTLIVAIQL